jgi:hypothetical protein
MAKIRTNAGEQLHNQHHEETTKKVNGKLEGRREHARTE